MKYRIMHSIKSPTFYWIESNSELNDSSPWVYLTGSDKDSIEMLAKQLERGEPLETVVREFKGK